MRRLLHGALIVVASVGAIGVSRPAFAGPADACIAASEHAQELRNAGKLTAARDELIACSKPECPKIIQTDCTRWMGEVLAALPSVVPAAKDPSGRDVVEARFSIDGKVATEMLDGKPVPVDTGVHVFRIEAAGMKAAEERVVIRAGEQNRVVSLKLEAAPVAPPPATPTTEPPKPEKSKPFPILPVAVGAAGVALLGFALYMNLSGTSDAHDLRETCAPNCRQSDVDDIKTKYVIAGVSAGVGAAAVVGAAALYFTRKSSDAGFGFRPLMNGGAMATGRVSF